MSGNGNARVIALVVALVTIIGAVVSVGVWAGSTGSDLRNHTKQEAHPEAAKRLREVETKVRVIENDLGNIKTGQEEIKNGVNEIKRLLQPTERPR